MNFALSMTCNLRLAPWLLVGTMLWFSQLSLADDRPGFSADLSSLAFPGAEGYGRFARGGRGGDVYHVTTLADSGPGSLREAIRSASGPRTIVFGVSGTIQLKGPLTVDKSHLTIAGQTAPGDGITLRDFTFRLKNVHDVIVRYLRFRLGDENKPKGAKGGDDTLNTDDIDRVIIDHCSLSWAIDGTHDLRRGGNFTLQWCVISEALNRSIHGKDGGHAMAASYRDLSGPISLHHNLISTCRDRHPTLGSAQQPPQHVVDFRNNVIYNWSKGGTANFADHFICCVNNTWRPGPMTDVAALPIAMKGNLPNLARGFMHGNVFEGRDDLTRDNYAALDFVRWLKPGSKYTYSGKLADWKSEPPDIGENAPITHSAAESYELVLTHAGASLHRDTVDVRVMADVHAGKGELLDSQSEVGGWPELASRPAPLDTDVDGMPDAWEIDHHLDPHDPADRNFVQNEYTYLEHYLNSLIPLSTSAP